MTINTLDDLFKGGKFTYIYHKGEKINRFSVFIYSNPNRNIIEDIEGWAKQVYEWWIELDPKVIEEVNREFDLSK